MMDTQVEIERLNAVCAKLSAALARVASGETEPHRIAIEALRGVFSDETVAGLEELGKKRGRIVA